jgi:poly(A) polymerase
MHGAARSVVQRLQKAGYVALFAGGCVRDHLMGKRPHDYDVATSARPEQVAALFRRTQMVGAQFGVVLARVGRFAIEVATFRIDVDYQDGRHPTKVQFTDARQDARRRDFTINGIFHDPLKRQVVDYVDGRADLQAGIIRAIGDPRLRFAEDHLRILRAVRFAARFDFTIHPRTWSAMRANAPSIRRISPERIREELDAILSHPSRARAFADLQACGALQHLWPDAPDCATQHGQIKPLLAALPSKARFEIGLTGMLQHLPEPKIEAACDALRCSNQTKRVVTWLAAHQDTLAHPADLTLADLKLLMAHPAFNDLLTLFAAKLRASGRPPTPYRRILARVRSIPADQAAPPPLVNGRYLEKLGVPKGPIYKTILDQLYYAQLNGDLTTPNAARAHARRLRQDAQV